MIHKTSLKHFQDIKWHEVNLQQYLLGVIKILKVNDTDIIKEEMKGNLQEHAGTGRGYDRGKWKWGAGEKNEYFKCNSVCSSLAEIKN